MQKTAALYFCTPETINCASIPGRCKKPLRSVFALRRQLMIRKGSEFSIGNWQLKIDSREIYVMREANSLSDHQTRQEVYAPASIQFRVFKTYDDLNRSESLEILARFLYVHLGKYGDPEEDIAKALNYALSNTAGKGGFVIAGYHHNRLVSALVINATGMSGYIPEYILVYVAVHAGYRNQGIGRAIVKKAIDICDGDIALHAEHGNPAKRLYEQIGFTVKYEEMRYFKKQRQDHNRKHS
jgi:GNAT superfamily N-acetyltransferase